MVIKQTINGLSLISSEVDQEAFNRFWLSNSFENQKLKPFKRIQLKVSDQSK